VTPERLLNPEPQNWLTNHRTYNGQRFSPLARINKGNVKSLKLAYAVPLGGSSGNEFIHATPLAEDGFIYITDSWGVLYKIDGTSGEVGRIVWRMDPKQQRQEPKPWRGFMEKFRHHCCQRTAADRRDGQGDRQNRLGILLRRYA
jgi:alcohol dehydrogenase (cytochrome c)